MVDGDRGGGESEAQVTSCAESVRESVDDRQENGHAEGVTLVYTYPQRDRCSTPLVSGDGCRQPGVH